MDKRLRYEQLIAGKLESLPIPDMEDAIWARVKAQLDIDLPGDEGGAGTGSPTVPPMVGWGLTIVILSLITAFFIYKNKPAATNLPDQTTPAQQTITPAQEVKPPPLKGDKPSVTTTTTESASLPEPTVRQQDSMQAQDVVNSFTKAVDSVMKDISSPVVAANKVKDTIPAVKKKGKGVSGLKDEDYKIVPRKDNE
jgi:hypothetical protein